MESTKTDHLRYPIGPFVRKEQYSGEEINSMIAVIEEAPLRFKLLMEMLPPEDLSKTYRPGSWNVQQLVHHVADIQLLHFLRMKKALTEADYKEVTLIDMDGWAVTPDARDEPVEDSLLMLDGITRRYLFLLRSLTEEQLKIAYYHPVRKYTINQAQAIAMSAWHLEHHLAHISLAVS
ncbi:DinB family protein [Anseongella ginsenosidimutans]|uniref:DinB family protein n=1 Tax=Anseongella ginsenosidimutans TaxID=496056 RepID=A0A4R3KNY8_9SPHI|nr:DinB family protein [Anseongella ginsenosidimutans]QEC53729.1 hypothetical protein FRZ59_16215 [Anseongella ginsenosidimutans]TCS86017.1 DinB family protein [Anseongella ginsenosidimutans]